MEYPTPDWYWALPGEGQLLVAMIFVCLIVATVIQCTVTALAVIFLGPGWLAEKFWNWVLTPRSKPKGPPYPPR